MDELPSRVRDGIIRALIVASRVRDGIIRSLIVNSRERDGLSEAFLLTRVNAMGVFKL